MRMPTISRFMLVAVATVLAGCATPGAVRIVQPLAAEARSNVRFAEVAVVVAETARENVARLDAKAAEKRAERSLPPIAGESATRPIADEYATLPLEMMLRLAVEDAVRVRSAPGGKPLKITVQIDNFRTANAAAAWLAGSNDQLAGLVTVSDPATGQKLGSFFVDVLEIHSGLLAMAMRGSGVREKLVEQVADHVRDNL